MDSQEVVILRIPSSIAGSFMSCRLPTVNQTAQIGVKQAAWHPIWLCDTCLFEGSKDFTSSLSPEFLGSKKYFKADFSHVWFWFPWRGIHSKKYGQGSKCWIIYWPISWLSNEHPALRIYCSKFSTFLHHICIYIYIIFQ